MSPAGFYLKRAARMPKHEGNTPERPTRKRPGGAGGAAEPSRPQPQTLVVPPSGAPGDEPLSIPAMLTLDEPFRFDRGLAKRLQMREVNAKEAFTARDASDVYFRASVKEYDGKGGLAVAYERMSRSP